MAIQFLHSVCRPGNREKLRYSQAELGPAIKSAVAYFASISGVANGMQELYTCSPAFRSLASTPLRSVLQKGSLIGCNCHDSLLLTTTIFITFLEHSRDLQNNAQIEFSSNRENEVLKRAGDDGLIYQSICLN